MKNKILFLIETDNEYILIEPKFRKFRKTELSCEDESILNIVSPVTLDCYEKKEGKAPNFTSSKPFEGLKLTGGAGRKGIKILPVILGETIKPRDREGRGLFSTPVRKIKLLSVIIS
ncbi:hypothetical protein ACFLYY_01630 [Patescibacteria group bacterium]